MTYNLKLTNGSTLVPLADGVSDTTYSDITLFGKNFAGYGPLLNENQIHILENFSNVSPPTKPLQGQLWWNSQTQRMNVRTLQEWKVIGSPIPSPTAPPVNNVVGDQWWNTDAQQLHVFNGNSWSLIGPNYTAAQGISGPKVIDVPGEYDGALHTVTEFFASGVVVAILSNNPTFTTTAIPGFYTIKPGFTLSSIGALEYHGDSHNALRLGDVLAANYLRSDVASATLFPLSIKHNDGLNVGTFNDLNIAIQGNEIAFLNNTTGRDISFYVKDSLGQQSLALRIDGVTSKLLSYGGMPVTGAGVVTKQYADELVATTTSTLLRADGATPIIGNLSPVTNGLYSLGSVNTRFDTVFSTDINSSTFTVDRGTANSILIADAPLSLTSATNKGYVDSRLTALSEQTTAAIQESSALIVGSAPANLATLGSFATAINNDADFANTIKTLIDAKAPQVSPDLLGTPQAPTPAAGDASSRIATTLFVNKTVATAIEAALATPIFSGQIIAPAGVQVTGDITTTTSNASDIGAIGHTFRDVYASTFKGTSMSANYADLAENYHSDAPYEPGTVLEFGGEYEVTIGTPWTTKVAGVVSENPAYLMNTNCDGKFVVAIALQGRCPVKVRGAVNKGDLLVSSGDGYAERKYRPELGTVIGKALQNFNGETGVVEVAISRC